MTTPLADLLTWLDSTNPRTDDEISMRILKIGEEFGEVASAYIGMTGQNPRKGVTHTRDDLTAELCDVIVTAMVALASVTGDAGDADRLVHEHLSAHLARVVARVTPAPAGSPS